MGVVGCYTAHFYCDCCNDFAEVANVETYEECLEAASKGKDGWLMREDGVILCEVCKSLKVPELIPEEKREGIEWNWHKNKETQQ